MTHEEFMADVERFHAETEAMAEEWAAWRERVKTKQNKQTVQHSLPAMFAMLEQILAQIAEIKSAMPQAD